MTADGEEDMPTWFWILVVVSLSVPVIIRLVFQWIIAPIRIHAHQTLAVKPSFLPAHPDNLTPEIRETFAVVVPQLQAEGFDHATYLHHVGSASTESVVALMVNRATGDVSQVIGVVSAGGDFMSATRSTVFTIRSEFADGHHVVTGSTRKPGCFPPNPDVDYQAFPWVRDAHTLCEVHRRRLARRGLSDVPRLAPPVGDELGYFEREWERETKRYVSLGYKYLDATAGLFRMTWRGAFLSSWKLTGPILRWRARRLRSRALAEWRALGMDEWRPPIAPAAPHAALAAAALPTPGPSAPAVAPPAPLRYDVALTPGEIREDSAPEAYLVRVGVPTIRQYLASRWMTVLSVAFWGAALLYFGILSWRIFGFIQARPGVAAPPLRLTAVLILPVFFFVSDVARLVVGLIVLRGTTLLTANGDGLTFRNVPAFNAEGVIAREEIDNLLVVLHRGGFRRKNRLYRLYVKLESGRAQTLLVHPDPQALNQLRSRLAQAMGIESAFPIKAAPTVSS